jgi:pyruvate dehydrogenase E2 component (dihydrolipoamide acetyltransferase)
MEIEFKLPEVGENIEKASVVSVMVAVGDFVQKGQSVLEIETDKATLEVPSGVEGRVTAIAVGPGDPVRIGQAILTVDADGKAPAPAPIVPPDPAPIRPEPVVAAAMASAVAATPVVSVPSALSASLDPSAPSAPSNPSATVPSAPAPAMAPLPGLSVAAAPSVRRLAREIGVAIGEVEGTGPGGRISDEDVKAHAKSRAAAVAVAAGTGAAAGPLAPPEPLPDFAKWGEIERQPMSNIRKVISRRLGYAWAAIPHVHQHDKADVTELEAFRREANAHAPKGSAKLTMTAILLKLSAILLRRYPQFNATYDAASQELILKHYVHIGVAVDAPRGLVVPVLRDVDKKSARELAAELEATSAKARDGKLTLEEMRGGTFTISNLGGIGGTSFNPIINWPEVAILGVSRARKELALIDGQPAERLMLPLCVAYDHRVIDGADGARFVAGLTGALANPYRLLVDF